MKVLIDTSGFLISSAIRATTRVRSCVCSTWRRWVASSFCAVRSSKTRTAPSGSGSSPRIGYVETSSQSPRRASCKSAPVTAPPELIVERDVADRRGEVRGEVEEGLGLAAAVGRADDRLADQQDRHELAVGQEGDGEHTLEQLELAHDLGVGQLVHPGGSSLRGQ